MRSIRQWRTWRGRWDDLCRRCGKCCYARHAMPGGEVLVNYDAPCDNLNTETNLCEVYDARFEKCAYCRKLTLRTALFNRTLPDDCGYVQAFRVWRKPRG